MSAGVDAFKIVQKQTSYRPYDIDAIGGGIRLGLPITDKLSLKLNYKINQRDHQFAEERLGCTSRRGDDLSSSVGYASSIRPSTARVDPHKGSTSSSARILPASAATFLHEDDRRGPLL